MNAVQVEVIDVFKGLPANEVIDEVNDKRMIPTNEFLIARLCGLRSTLGQTSHDYVL